MTQKGKQWGIPYTYYQWGVYYRKDIFDKLGIYDRIAKKGVQWSVGRTFAGADEVYSFDLRQQSAYNLSSQPPFINIQQFYIEGYLVERIHELGDVELRWNNRVIGFEQDADAATLTITTPAGDYRLRADHVIDATGSRSPFHAWAGATLTGKKGDDLISYVSALANMDGGCVVIGAQDQWRCNRDLLGGQFGRERMLFQDLRIAPALGPVELGHHCLAIDQEHLEDAVLVGIELQKATVAAHADAIEGVEDQLGRQPGERGG
jgi:hypothetical protein